MAVMAPTVVITFSSSVRTGGGGCRRRCGGTGDTARRTFTSSPGVCGVGDIGHQSRVRLLLGCRDGRNGGGRDETRGHSRTVVRAEPTSSSSSFNELVLQGGPLLLPLVLSTSAALYRSASKVANENGHGGDNGGDGDGGGSGGLAILLGAFGVLPKGMWVGIGMVWAYWISTQPDIF